MARQSGSPPRKGPHWLAERITASFEAAGGELPPPPPRRLSRPEIDDLISRTLEEELERLEKPPG